MNERDLKGAYNLLVNCGQACEGERLLLCYEQKNLDFYDNAIVEDVWACAQEIGLAGRPNEVWTLQVGSADNPVLCIE